MKLGFKSKWTIDQLKKRVELNPYFIEIFIANNDLETRLTQISDNLQYLTENFPKIKLSIHQPEKYKKQFLNLATNDKNILTNTIECLSILNDLSKKYQMMGFVIHPYWTEDFNYKNIDDLIFNLEKLSNFKENLFLENELNGCFSTPENIIPILSKTGFRFVLDVCHLRIASIDSQTFSKNFNLCRNYATYFHLSDTDGFNDNALSLSEGVIDWMDIKKTIKVGLIEVVDQNYIDIPNAINSYKYLIKL